MKHFKQSMKYGFGASLMGLATASQAAIDTTAVITATTDASAAVATIGAAVLVVIVGVKAYKWIRGAL